MKRFIREILPSYEGVEIKYIGGAPPEAVFSNDQDEEVKRVDLSGMNEDEIGKLLEDHGFHKKANNEEL